MTDPVTPADVANASTADAPASSPAEAHAAEEAAPATSPVLATKATVEKDDEQGICIVCGKLPKHDEEECEIYKAGPQAVLDLMAMIRGKPRKTKKDKDASKILMRWASAQLHASQDEPAASQEASKPSQGTTAPSATEPGANAEVASTQASATTAEPSQNASQSPTVPEPVPAKKQLGSPLLPRSVKLRTRPLRQRLLPSRSFLLLPASKRHQYRRRQTLPASPEKPAAKNARGQQRSSSSSQDSKRCLESGTTNCRDSIFARTAQPFANAE